MVVGKSTERATLRDGCFVGDRVWASDLYDFSENARVSRVPLRRRVGTPLPRSARPCLHAPPNPTPPLRFHSPRAPPFLSTQFLCYKTLKKCLKSIPEAFDKAAEDPLPPGRRRQLTDEQRAFVKTLNAELQKFNRFFINSEEDFVMKETKLEEEFRRVVNEDGSRGPEFTLERHRRACRAFADFHGELVLMEHWVSLNYTALVKILKKHDKRSTLSLRSPFLVSVLQQPFYSTEVLSQLITKTEARFRKLNAVEMTDAERRESAAADASVAEVRGWSGDAEADAGKPRAEKNGNGDDARAETNRGGDAGTRARGAAAEGDAEDDDEDEEEGEEDDGERAGSPFLAGLFGEATAASLARTRAAISCWDGMKDEESVLRPYGEVPGGRKRGGEEGGVTPKRIKA